MMIDAVVAPFADFAFIRRGLTACLAMAMGGAPLGCFLVARRMSLTGEAMAHGILPGVAIVLATMSAVVGLLLSFYGAVAAGPSIIVVAGALCLVSHRLGAASRRSDHSPPNRPTQAFADG